MSASVKIFVMWLRLSVMSLGGILFMLAGSMEPFEWKFFFVLLLVSALLIAGSSPKKAIHMVDVYKRYRKINGYANR